MDHSISCVSYRNRDKCESFQRPNTEYHDYHIHILIYKRHFKDLLDHTIMSKFIFTLLDITDWKMF